MSPATPASDAAFALEGTLKVLPSPEATLLEVVSREYAALAEAYGPRNVLVLKRHPTGLVRVREALARTSVADGTPRSPRLESVPEHASKVVEEYDPTLDRLEYEERIELISLVIAGASREIPPYLERASVHESFARDVGQLLLEATRQRIRYEDFEDSNDLHDCLAFLYAMNDRFHGELERRGFVERTDVIPRAVDLLEADEDGLRTRVGSSFDAVLALEFEEFRRLDRRYLAALSADADLVCLGERHASVERTRVEPGRLEDVADGLEIEALESDQDADDERTPPHAAITRFFATGETPDATEPAAVDGSTADAVAGTAYRIRARTAREQVREVATEIQSLADRHEEWSYDAFAVAVPRVESIPETRGRLRAAGIPTATIGTPSLAEDPAVNELYAFVTHQCERERGGTADAVADRDADTELSVARDRLAARVEDFSPALLDACAGSSVRRSLERWLLETDLKGRIAREEDWVDAREQYAGVRRVLEIARFVEETDLVAPDWEGVRRMLRGTIRYDAPYVHAVETRSPTGGVAVCTVDDLKYDSREVVFLLDLVDDHYPGDGSLTQLFPTAWLREMPAFPAVTDPSPTDLERTFAPISSADEVADPFEAYHAQRARRRLAIGARAARSRLYCCSYERGAGGLRRTHDESRYLKLLEAAPGLALEDVEVRDRTAKIYGETNALEALLDEPRGELERILREASTGGDADLGETEALFQEIAVVLERDVDDELAEAVRSQFEFAAGEVIRGE
ncbi:hypothetical protein ACFQGT_16705 [Natrialbaceae archaeon GCM10025810]|uniref:hypothetical protein n=1 Tax=Halovalidus salilacus TaxID=3075124 RepID=UPI00361DB1D9